MYTTKLTYENFISKCGSSFWDIGECLERLCQFSFNHLLRTRTSFNHLLRTRTNSYLFWVPINETVTGSLHWCLLHYRPKTTKITKHNNNIGVLYTHKSTIKVLQRYWTKGFLSVLIMRPIYVAPCLGFTRWCSYRCCSCSWTQKC